MNLEEANARIKELETRKAELIEQIKKLNEKLKYKRYESKAISPFVSSRAGYHAGPLRRRYNELEFRIATEAYTPKIEKEMIKELKKMEAELKKAEEAEKARRAQLHIEEDLKKAEEEHAGIEAQLQGIRGELNNLYDFIRTERAKQAEERREKRYDDMRERAREERSEDRKKEWSQYMKPVDSHVSLEDVVIIEKKKKGDEE
jgi:uncharacterized coiled-coil DUF342 family protein